MSEQWIKYFFSSCFFFLFGKLIKNFWSLCSRFLQQIISKIKEKLKQFPANRNRNIGNILYLKRNAISIFCYNNNKRTESTFYTILQSIIDGWIIFRKYILLTIFFYSFQSNIIGICKNKSVWKSKFIEINNQKLNLPCEKKFSTSEINMF